MPEDRGGTGKKLRRSLAQGSAGSEEPRYLRRGSLPDESAMRAMELLEKEPLLDVVELNGNPKNADKEEAIKVFFIGCGDDFWKRMRRRLKDDGYGCSRVSNVGELIEGINGHAESSIVILGGEEDIDQETLLSYLKKKDKAIKVIFITDESAQIIPTEADAFAIKGNLEPRNLSRYVEVLSRQQKDKPTLQKPIICEVVEGRILKVDESRVERVKETMGAFSNSYDLHMRRHFAVMNAIVTSYPKHFGQTIIDFGCGTGHPMRQVTRNIFVPDFDASPPIRGKTRILSVDNSEKMLIEAQDGFMRLMEQHGHVLSNTLEMEFLLADFMSLNRGVLAEKGFEEVDTLFVSYLIHWASDKEATVSKMAELLRSGGKLITIEESPCIVTPGPHMPMELAMMIEQNILPMELDSYYDLLRRQGLKEVSSRLKMDIDEHHAMFGKVFVKP
jgi:ubiquinone/menaquinone biosynthesis C-methylase UbiE